MFTDAEILLETGAASLGGEGDVSPSIIGRKVVLKEDTDIMTGNILPAGTPGYVVRRCSLLPGDQSIVYVAFNRRPSGFEDCGDSFNWFVNLSDVEFVESPKTDGLPAVYTIGNPSASEGQPPIEPSIGFVLWEDLGEEEVTVAFPRQDFQGFDGADEQYEFVVQRISYADVQYA